MKIILKDIASNEVVVAHTITGDITLGEIFKADPKLVEFEDYLHEVRIDGMPCDTWKSTNIEGIDLVEFYVRPGFGTIVVIFGVETTVGAVLSVALTVVSLISTLVSMLTAPKPTDTTPGENEPNTYGFQGLSNTFTPGSPIQVVYGRHRMGGQVLGMTIDVQSGGRGMLMSELIALGRGVITNVNCLEVNGISIDKFPGISSSGFRLGTSSQAALPGYERTRNTFHDGREVSTGGLTYTTNAVDAKAVEIQIGAVNGLIHRNTKGEKSNNTIYYTIEAKPNAWSTNSYFTVAASKSWTEKSTAGVWDATKIDFVEDLGEAAGQWDMRVTWESARKTTESSPHRIWLSNVTEIEDDPVLAYSGIAMLSFNGIATDALQGGRPTITAIVDGMQVRVHSTAAAFNTAWSQNPAWCVRDYMTNSIYGMGGLGISDADIEVPSFLNFAILCNSGVPDGRGGLEPRHQFDFVLDRRKPHLDIVNDILKLYASALIYSNGQYKIVTDRDDEVVRQVFHAGNIINMNVKVSKEIPVPNQINATFANEILDYERDVRYIQDSESIFADDDTVILSQPNAFVINRDSEIDRFADRILERKRYKVFNIEITTGMEAIAVEPGDRYVVGNLTTDFDMGWGGRVKGLAVTAPGCNDIILDRTVDLAACKNYTLYVWERATDSVHIHTVDTVILGATQQVPVTGGTSATEGDRWAIGENSVSLYDLRCTEVSRDIQKNEYTIRGQREGTFVFKTHTPGTISGALNSVNSTPFNTINDMPTQPMSVTMSNQYITLATGETWNHTDIDISPSPRVIASALHAPSANSGYVILSSTAAPAIDDFYNGAWIRLNYGTGSEHEGRITDYIGASRYAIIQPGMSTNANTGGDLYEILLPGGLTAGYDILRKIDRDYVLKETIFNTEYNIESEIASYDIIYAVVPFNQNGVRNYDGFWEGTITPTVDPPVGLQPSNYYSKPRVEVITVPFTLGYIHLWNQVGGPTVLEGNLDILGIGDLDVSLVVGSLGGAIVETHRETALGEKTKNKTDGTNYIRERTLVHVTGIHVPTEEDTTTYYMAVTSERQVYVNSDSWLTYQRTLTGWEGRP